MSGAFAGGYAALDLCRAAGTLWVAADGGDRPIGRLAASECDGALLILDLRVAPEHRGRGLGGALLAAAIDHARWAFLPAVAAIADPAVPWSGPFLGRRGFVALDGARASPGLRERLEAALAQASDGARPRLMAKLL